MPWSTDIFENNHRRKQFMFSINQMCMLGGMSVQNPLTSQNAIRHEHTQTQDAIQWLLKEFTNFLTLPCIPD